MTTTNEKIATIEAAEVAIQNALNALSFESIDEATHASLRAALRQVKDAHVAAEVADMNDETLKVTSNNCLDFMHTHNRVSEEYKNARTLLFACDRELERRGL